MPAARAGTAWSWTTAARSRRGPVIDARSAAWSSAIRRIAGAEVRVQCELGPLDPGPDLLGLGVAGQLRGHRAHDPRERGADAETAEDGVEEVSDEMPAVRPRTAGPAGA